MHILKVLYTARRKSPIINLTPHIPIDETSERHAYSVLLLYSDWGLQGESGLLGHETSAIKQLLNIQDSLPLYVQHSLERLKQQEEIMQQTNDPIVDFVAAADDFDEYVYERTARFRQEEFDDIEEQQFQHQQDATILTNTPKSQVAYLQNYIYNLKQNLKSNFSSQCQMNNDQLARKHIDPTLHFDVDDMDIKSDELDAIVAVLNQEQMAAYDTAIDHISGNNPKQLIQFVTGEGGTGKSKLIEAITLYTQILYGKTEGRHGVVLKTAPTGGAAYNIRGSTWQSALGKTDLKRFTITAQLSENHKANLSKDLKGTQVFILDELSLVSKEDLLQISVLLSVGTGNKKPFGGLHVILAGDMYQMRTMGGTPIVQPLLSSASEEAILGYRIFKKINSFVELTANMRAKSENGKISKLASFVCKARLGTVTKDDICLINTRVVNNIEQAIRKAHHNALFITSTHQRIGEINQVIRKKMEEEGSLIYRIVANHKPKRICIPVPNTAKLRELYGVAGNSIIEPKYYICIYI